MEVIGKENLPTVDDFGTTDLESMYKEYVLLKKNIDDLTARQNVIKKELMDFVDGFGLEDDKGHKWYDMPEYGGYNGMQKQRRVSQSIDQDAAEAILTDKGLFDRCFETKPVLNEQSVMECVYEGILTEEDVDAMFPKKITNAFVLKKA